MLHSQCFYKQYINGRWTDSASDDMIEVKSPVTFKTITSVAAGDPQDARDAIAAAKEAFPAWARLPLEARIHFIAKLHDGMMREFDLLSALETAELGSPKHFAEKKHVAYQLSRIPAYIDCARRFARQTRTPGATVRAEPIGPVVAVTPWNYPLGQIIQKIVPALLMGNTVVLKPSSLAPLTAVVLARVIEEAGFPRGVFNLINGSGERFGDSLFTNSAVSLVSFTGSTAKGKEIASLCAPHLIRTSLELGGKSPAVWLPGLDDYSPACKRLFDSVFLNAGQTCTALSRLLIEESMNEETALVMKRMIRCYPAGRPDDPRSALGPVISLDNYLRIRALMIEALIEGAEILIGAIPPEIPTEGYFIEPTVFTRVTPEMRIWREEIFGPVLSVMTYRTIEEAVSLANDTPYGLSSAIAGPRELIEPLAERIDAGNVFLNNAARDITAPFGGFKESGWGYESGEEGLRMFVRYKSVFDVRNDE